MSIVDLPSSQSQADAAAVPGETCPRCHTTQSWGESSWCPNCNYYPVVDGSGAAGSWADNLPPQPVEAVADDRTALESIPAWFWGMLAGVVGITAFSVTIRVMFPDEESPRGLIAIAQACIGLVSMLVSHIIAAKYALANDRRLNINDVLLSWFNIWQPTIARLPKTCPQILAMAWGGFAVLTAVTVIGGIDYSAPFRVHQQPEVKPMKLIGQVAAAAKAQAGGDQPASMEEALADLQQEVANMEDAAGDGAPKSMEDALNELGDMDDKLSGLEGLDEEEALEEMQTYTMHAWVYGVETNAKNVPTAFLFAANTRGEEQHVCRIKAEEIPREDFRAIAVQLYTAIRKEPLVPTSLEAVWVKRLVTCRIAFKGFLDSGEFRKPEFEARVIKQRGTYSREDGQLKIKE